jgi:hypothetical protein
MKNLVLGSFILFFVFILSSCDKNEEKKVDIVKHNSTMKVSTSEVGTCCANIAFHRAIFKKNNGTICNCANCTGICKIDPDKGWFDGYIVISNDSSYATVYSLGYIDDDNDFRIDYDIDVLFTVDNGGFDGLVKFKAGEYDYTSLEEDIVIDDSTYIAYGSVDVDILIE